MRIATWNVNSLRTRGEQVLEFLQTADIDVLAMQEIKCRPEQFASKDFIKAGYHLEMHGFNQWNGVAFASRYEIEDIATSFAEQPGFGLAVKGQENKQLPGANNLPLEARALGVTVNGIRLWSLYVPNGRSLQHAHYTYKLQWLEALHKYAALQLQQQPHVPFALMGDFNIAPTAKDMGDPAFVAGLSTHISGPEREAFARLEEELVDVVRPYAPEGYTFWDYQAGKYERNQGMRIDFILGSRAFNDAVTNAYIARAERDMRPGKNKPSDHVPVVCEVDEQLLAEENWQLVDDSPMIF